MICRGCIHTVQFRALLAGRSKEDDICPFCRVPTPTTDDEILKRLEKRTTMNDARAIFSLGCSYSRGNEGLSQNRAKALELWHRAAELGSAEAYYNIGYFYMNGIGVDRDKKKAIGYYKLAAIKGERSARNTLGCFEAKAGNYERGMKHWMIAVKSGCADSLDNIKRSHLRGYTSKDDYANALRSYQAHLDEIKSGQRDEAAAYKDEWKYF